VPAKLTRRTLLTGATGASALSAAASPPPRVLGANERLHVGVIGAGGNATGHMRALKSLAEQDNVEIVAVCDLWDKRLEAAAEFTGGKPYKDYRRLLELKGLDYVTISVPEHWHAPITLDALDLGFPVYCEKPMTYSIEEGKRVLARVKEAGVLMQVGVQGMSDDSYETAAKYIREGAIGEPVMAHIDYSRNHLDDYWYREHDPDLEPGVNFDWKRWLGPAPDREFDPDRFFGWRRYWDYSGGIATDLFVHRITRIVKALDLKAPNRVVATGGKFIFEDSAAEVPDTFNVLVEYPEGINVLLVSTMGNSAKIRHLIRGHKATLEFNDEGFEITPEKLFEDEVGPVTHQKTGAENVALHHHNLHNAIRHGAELNCPPELGFYGALPCQMAVESFRSRKYLSWDAESETVTEA